MPSAEPTGASAFRRIGERERADAGFFRLVTATFVGPDGFTFERQVVRHPGAVCAVPLHEDRQHVTMIRQYRGAAEQALLELPAGKRDVPGEDPADTIARELVEEIGQEAGELTELARFYNSPGFSDEMTICYLAERLSACERDAHGVEEQHLSIERVRLDDVDELVASGRLLDAKSIVGLAAARFLIAREASEEPVGLGGSESG